MNPETNSPQSIYNYLKINDQVSTGGQPTAPQLAAAAAEGFTAVVNLATFEMGHSLPDEAGLVHSLGMAYYPIPVDWNNPTPADFTAFEGVLQRLGAAKTLIHCAANFRVTAFYSLYAQKHLGWTPAQAAELRARIWSGSRYPVWERFIQDIEAQSAR